MYTTPAQMDTRVKLTTERKRIANLAMYPIPTYTIKVSMARIAQARYRVCRSSALLLES